MYKNEIIENYKTKITQICESLKILDDEKNFLNKQIKEYEKSKEKDLKVTDHAIVQYCSRVLGLDIDEITKQLLKDDLETRYKILDDGVFDQKEFRVRIINNTIVTTLEPKK